MTIAKEDKNWMGHTITASRRWYDRSSSWNYWLWRWSQLLSVVGAALGAVFAVQADSDPVFKWLAVGSSLVATVSASLLSTFRFSSVLQAREYGRIRTEDLENRAFLFFDSDPDVAEKLRFKAKMCDDLRQLEYDQLARFSDVVKVATDGRSGG